MPYLVDGSNLGGAMAGAAGARDRAAVLRLLLDFARGGRRVVVVFDGPRDESLAHDYGPLQVRFAAGRSADERILALLPPRAGGWRVVSADRALRAAARERGAEVMSPAELLAGTARSEGSVPPAGERGAAEAVDVAEWEEWFRRRREEGEEG